LLGLNNRDVKSVGGQKEILTDICHWNLTILNGDYLDNRLENLRVLCPNCHSLKPDYRGRNIGKNN